MPSVLPSSEVALTCVLSHRAELISAVLLVFVFLVLERGSSPLCFVPSSRVHLRSALFHRAELISAVLLVLVVLVLERS